jgi:Ser/Thr protein kinase RdoA (MazF antagonist)
VHEVGRGLAELHASGATPGPAVTWESELAAVRRGFDELGAAVPAVSGAMDALLSGLAALAEDTPAGPLVPTHRSFRPAQVLLQGDDIAFIDFDAVCHAEAGLDVALFRNTLCDLSLRALEDGGGRPLDGPEAGAQAALDELCTTFLAGYQEVADLSMPRLALWDALTGARDILDCWRKVKFEHLERRMALLRRQFGPEALSA